MRSIERTTICVVLTIVPFVGIGCILRSSGPPKLTRKEPKIFAVQRDKPFSAQTDTKNQISESDQSEKKADAPTTNPEIAANDRSSKASMKGDVKSSSSKVAAKRKKRESEPAVAVSNSERIPEMKPTSAPSTANSISPPPDRIVFQSSTANPVKFSDASEIKPESSLIKLVGHEESTDGESEEIEFEIPKPVSSPIINPEVPERAWDAPDTNEIEESLDTSSSNKANEGTSPNGLQVQVETISDRDFQQVCLVKFKEERVFTPGLSEFTVEYRAQRYRFSSAEAAEKFQTTPEQFVPIAGGLDIVAFGNNQEVVHGSLEFAVWYNKQLFLFSNHENIRTFQRQPEKFMAIK